MRSEQIATLLAGVDAFLVPQGFARRKQGQEWRKRIDAANVAWVHVNVGLGIINPSLGVSYSDLVDEVRLARALALIDDPSIKLWEISRRLGYADAANFDRAFRRWTGHSPSQVRALDRKSRIDLIKRKASVSAPPSRSDRK